MFGRGEPSLDLALDEDGRLRLDRRLATGNRGVADKKVFSSFVSSHEGGICG